MVKRLLVIAFIALVLALAACAATPSILPFLSFSNRQHDVTFYTAEADTFSVDLPEGWVMSGPRENPWGVEYYIGPDPLADGMNSYVMIFDPTQHSIRADIERLSQQWPDAVLNQVEARFSDQSGTQVTARFPDGSRTDVFYIPYAGSIYSLWFHNADSLNTRLDLLNSFRFTN